MSWSRRLPAAFGLVAALLLSACGRDNTPTYRYRLKVEVETPQGLRTGSSVIEVKTRIGRNPAAPSSQAVRWKVRGEAVAVDLPGGKTLFALLRSPSDVEWAARVMLMQAPSYQGEPFDKQLDNMIGMNDELVLHKYFRKKVLGHWQPAYPMLVTFADISNPATAKQVDPENLAAAFGEGVSLQRITVQMTGDEVTTGIEKRLGWLRDYYDKMLDGQRIHNAQVFANNLSQADFVRRTIR